MTDTQEPVETTNLSKKKKFRYYDSYISKVLKEVSKESGITNNAKQQLNSILITFARKIAENALELTEISGKRTLSDKEVSSAVQILFGGELKSHALTEGEKAVQTFVDNDKEKGSSRQSRAGIIFPPSVSEKFLRRFDTSTVMVTNKSPIFF